MLLIIDFPAVANDTTATVTPSGIEYTTNPNVSIDEEILTISEDKIEVLYRFTNHSDKDLLLDVAFPLPPAPFDDDSSSLRVFPIWDESYLSYIFLDHNPLIKIPNTEVSNMNLFNLMQKGKAPFINFERKVNGESYGFNYRITAKTREGKDITEMLTNNNIPLSATFLAGFMEEGKLAQDKRLKDKLEKMQLLDAKGLPIWRNQTTYFWQQNFPAKKTIHVSHTYSPHPGQFFLILPKKGQSAQDIKFEHRDLEDKKLSNYCQSDTLKQFLDEEIKHSLLQNIQDEPKYLRVLEIDYILTTANNWKGPIKKFTLNIIPPANAKLAHNCEVQLQKQEEKYVYTKHNFTPSQDLKILFVLPKSLN